MKNIDIIRKAVSRKHPCDECHSAIINIESSIHDLIIAWNELPDELRMSDSRLIKLGEIVKDIG